jgi:hypothetical protein
LSLVFVCSAGQSFAGELTSPKGFTISYPEGWTSASKAEMDELAKNVRGICPSAEIYGPRREKYADSASVSILPNAIPVNDASEKRFSDLMQKVLTSTGKQLSNQKSQQIDIGGRKAISLSCECRLPGLDEPLRMWQLAIPGKSQTYMLSFVALKSRWADEWPAIKEIAKNFRIDVAP